MYTKMQKEEVDRKRRKGEAERTKHGGEKREDNSSVSLTKLAQQTKLKI